MDVKLTYSISSIGGYNFWQVPKCGTTTVKHELLKRIKPEAIEEIDDVCEWIHNSKEFTFLTPSQANSNGKYNFAFVRDLRSRFESLYKDFCLHRRLLPQLYGKSPEELFTALARVQRSERPELHNVHLRSISYFLKEFDGDIFSIDNLNRDKINHREEEYEVDPHLKRRIEDLWIDDFKFINMSQEPSGFIRRLEQSQ